MLTIEYEHGNGVQCVIENEEVNEETIKKIEEIMKEVIKEDIEIYLDYLSYDEVFFFLI
jgi:tagatose-1,6-bisphosphate aldolase